MKDNFKITLKAARVNAGYTLEEASKKLGIARSTLFNWEKEPWKVRAGSQANISSVYDIDIDYITFLPKN